MPLCVVLCACVWVCVCVCVCPCVCPLTDNHQPGRLSPAVGSVPALQGHPHQKGLCGDPDPENHIRYKHSRREISSVAGSTCHKHAFNHFWLDISVACFHVTAHRCPVSHHATVWRVDFLYTLSMSRLSFFPTPTVSQSGWDFLNPDTVEHV